MLRIDWATPEDIPGAIEVLKEIAAFRASIGQDRWKQEDITPENIGRWIEKGELVVARWDGMVVGTMLVQPEDKTFWPDDPPGEAMYVHRLSRSRLAPQAKGLAGPLVAFAEEETRRRGRPYLRLDCALDEKLCAIYERLDFKRLDLWEVTPDFHSWRWEKKV